MFFNVISATALVATVLAEPAASPMPHQLGKMSFNQALGLMVRQDQGYQPTQTQCGPGSDCPSSCGPDTVQCASTDDQLHCYEPSLGESCCSDGSGNACDEGYYCTDNSAGTWCCPNGTSLRDCEALYSLSGALTSESTLAPSSTATISPAPVSVSISATQSSSFPTSTASISISAVPSSSLPISTVSNGTTSGTSTGSTVLFTGAANRLAGGGVPAFAVVAGVVLAL